MKKKNTLSVKPLRKYNTPVYPSYLDKNPIDHPDTLPYPFSYKALQVLAGVGILVGSAAISGCGVLSPFKFKDMNVPFSTTSFGTGTASRLSSEEARDVINRVFKEEGIYLQENYEYKKGEVSALLNGFDPKRNIGYVWIDGNKMGDGMMINSRRCNDYDGIINRKLLDYGTDKLHEVENLIEKRMKNINDTQKFNGRFEVAQKIEVEEEKLQVYKDLFLDIYIVSVEKYEFKADFKYIKHLLDSDIPFEEKEKIYHLFSHLGRQISIHNELTTHNIKDVLSEILLEIVSLENEEEKRNQYNNFSAFLKAHGAENRAKIENGPTQEILTTKDKETLAEQIQLFASKYLDGKISLEEAKQLQGTHKGDCIAPISVRDDRLYYNLGYPGFTKREDRKLEKIHKKRSKEEYREAYMKIMQNAEERNPKDETLKDLEKQVRQYIRWAKLQARY